jgi:hypothetical protein
MSDDASAADGGRRLLTSGTLLFAVVLLVGVAGSGLARRFLGEMGYDTIGMVVYVLGYGGMVVLVWWGWLRPLDITGPVDRD